MKKAFEKGRRETEEKNYEFVKSLLVAGKFTIAEIAYYSSVSEEYVLRVKGSL